MSAPSLLQAATRVTAQAMTEKARESFMMAGWTERVRLAGRGEVRWCGVVRPIRRPGGIGGDVAPSLALKDWTASWTWRVGEYGYGN